MTYPVIYDVTYSYSTFQQSQGDNAFPGTQVDADLAGLADSLANLSTFAQGVMRSDGALQNGIVTFDSLSSSLQTAGLVGADAWLTGTLYAVGAPVAQDNNLYRCSTLHTSGVFATDLAAGKWVFIAHIGVVGPASSIAGNVPKFSDTSGGLLADSGVPIASLAPLNSPALTGVPTAPTAAPGNNSAQLATTAYIDTAAGLKANIASPTFTGAPLTTTAAVDTNTTQIASTAFVLAQAAAASPLMNGAVAVGASTRFARADHVHPVDTSRQALLTAGQLPGTATNDSASVGNVGEYRETIVLQASQVALTNGAPATAVSLSLPAGDWDVTAIGVFNPAGATTLTYVSVSLSLTTNVLDTTSGRFVQIPYPSFSPGGVNIAIPVPSYRFSLASTTTVFLVVQSAFAVSTMGAYGILKARRMR